EIVLRLLAIRRGEAIEMMARAVIGAPGIERSERRQERTLALDPLDLGFDDGGDAIADLALQPEDVLDRAVEMLGPDLAIAPRVGARDGQPQAPADHLDRAADGVAYAEPLADRVERVILKPRRAGACGHEQPARAGKPHGEIVGEAVGEQARRLCADKS